MISIYFLLPTTTYYWKRKNSFILKDNPAALKSYGFLPTFCCPVWAFTSFNWLYSNKIKSSIYLFISAEEILLQTNMRKRKINVLSFCLIRSSHFFTNPVLYLLLYGRLENNGQWLRNYFHATSKITRIN